MTTEEQIEKARGKWAKVAKEYGWYTDPFYIQVWIQNGKVADAVAFKGMTKDIIIKDEVSAEAAEIWEKLGDIPIDEDECIEEKFMDFDIGTHREEIWHWIEDRYDISVALNLMHL